MAIIIASVAGGLEQVAGAELRDLGLAVRDNLRGAVLVDAPEFPSAEALQLLREINHWARGIDRIGVLLGHGPIASVDDCRDIARAVDYTRFVRPEHSFAVRARRRGEHEFGSLDVARVVGSAVIDAFRAAAGGRLEVSLEHPDVIVRVDVLDDTCRVWLDATGDEPLYARDYRRQLHPASLRASMAHLLLRVAGWRGQPLLDPMTGIGTIPIEAALYARAVAPGSQRGATCAIERIAATGPRQDAVAVPVVVRPRPLLDPDDPLDVRGLERYERHVQGAWLNLAAAGAPAGVRIEQGDAARLDRRLPTDRYRLAVVNPPFGRRVGSTGMVVDLYRRFARSAARAGVARIVTLAESRRAMASALEHGGYRMTRAMRIEYGDLPAWVLVAEARGVTNET